MSIAQTGWRTLAKPTYAVREFGQAVRLDAGTLLLPYCAQGVNPETGCGVKRGPEGATTFLVRDGEDGLPERAHLAADLVYVTASALRFEGQPDPLADLADVQYVGVTSTSGER